MSQIFHESRDKIDDYNIDYVLITIWLHFDGGISDHRLNRKPNPGKTLETPE